MGYLLGGPLLIILSFFLSLTQCVTLGITLNVISFLTIYSPHFYIEVIAAFFLGFGNLTIF